MTRCVLVTGASSGIGRALAGALAKRGDVVWGVARRADHLAALQRELPAGRFQWSACDVTQEAHVADAMRAMHAQRFQPDVVVLNAGVNAHDLLPRYDHQRYLEVMRTNLFGVMTWVDRWLPIFEARQAGHFIAISSMSAYLTHSKGAAYGASKAALTSTFDSLRRRYLRDRIHFTTVHLGPVQTAMWSGAFFPGLLSEAAVARKLMGAIDRRPAVVDYPCGMIWAARLSQLVPRWSWPRGRCRAPQVIAGKKV